LFQLEFKTLKTRLL